MSDELRLPMGPTLRRGASLRCPACGSGHVFSGWFSMVERCPRCDLRFERVDGQWTGSLGLNTMVTFSLLFVLVMVGTFATVPDVPVRPLVLFLLGVGVVFPVVFFPFSRTLWVAIDLLMRPPATSELDVDAPGVMGGRR